MDVQVRIRPFYTRKGLTEEEKILRAKQAKNRATVAYRKTILDTYRAYQRSVYQRRKEEDPEFCKNINEKNKKNKKIKKIKEGLKVYDLPGRPIKE